MPTVEKIQSGKIAKEKTGMSQKVYSVLLVSGKMSEKLHPERKKKGYVATVTQFLSDGNRVVVHISYGTGGVSK